MKVIMLNRIKQFPEDLKNSLGLVTLTVIIFFIFFVLNVFFGPDKNLKNKVTDLKKMEEKENELIVPLPEVF